MSEAAVPVTFYVPSSAREPIEIDVAHFGLRMALVNRSSIRLLDDRWKVPGVYFLLGADPDSAGRYLVYVGEVGKRDLVLRLAEHAASKDWWNRALLVASTSTDGFNSAEIGWLEGRFFDLLNNAVAATVKNEQRPGDDSIALKSRWVLEKYVEPVTAVLRAIGAPPDTIDQQAPPKGKKRAHYTESVLDLIEAGLLKPGTRLRPVRKNLTATAEVMADGSLDIDGVRYFAVSPAAQAASGNKSEPGWEFWVAPSGDGSYVSLFDLRKHLQESPLPSSTSGSTQDSSALKPGPMPRVGVQTAPGSSPARGKRHYPETIKDLISAELLAVGEELVPTRAGRTERARLLESGELEVGDVVFASPSSAAKGVTGNSSEPGWDFWAAERNGMRTTLSTLRDTLRKGNATSSSG